MVVRLFRPFVGGLLLCSGLLVCYLSYCIGVVRGLVLADQSVAGHWFLGLYSLVLRVCSDLVFVWVFT